MPLYVKRAIFYGLAWSIGDFVAQFYEAHKEAAAMRARGEARTGPRPTGAQMFALLDQERLLRNAVFGLVAGPVVGQYERFLPRIFGSLQGRATPCLCALGLQQLVMTPLILWSYFNAMTAVQGGLHDPSFMAAHDCGTHQRYDVAGVERYITQDVMPYPLLVSWGVYAPIHVLAYRGPFRGATFLSGCLFAPWCGLLSHIQSSELL